MHFKCVCVYSCKNVIICILGREKVEKKQLEFDCLIYKGVFFWIDFELLKCAYYGMENYGRDEQTNTSIYFKHYIRPYKHVKAVYMSRCVVGQLVGQPEDAYPCPAVFVPPDSARESGR